MSVKDPEFQRTTSLVVVLCFLFYNTVDAFTRVPIITKTYPKEQQPPTWTSHTLYFVRIAFEIYFWTLVMCLVSFVVLVLVKVLVLDIVKGDEAPTTTIKETVTIEDVKNAVFSAFITQWWLLLKLFLSNLVISLFYARFVAKPYAMAENKDAKRTFTEIYLTITFIQFVFVAALHFVKPGKTSSSLKK